MAIRKHKRELVTATTTLSGRGLHFGRRSRLRVLPAPTGGGIVLRTGAGSITAALTTARGSARRTTLQSGPVSVETVEHLLAALAGLGIWDAVVELDGFPEIPALDGSALPFVKELLAASAPSPTGATDRCHRVVRPISLRRGPACCWLSPAPSLTLECTIDFTSAAIGRQHARLRGQEQFVERLAPARSFGLLEEAGALRRAGLARGATLSNVVVFDGVRAMNPGGTRFVDEPVRHKMLDALGDLALLGGPLVGNVRLLRPSHRLVLETLRRALAVGALVAGD